MNIAILQISICKPKYDQYIYQDLFSSLVLQPLSNPLPILYLGWVSSALCNYLQTLGQRTISAERAAIIYSLDPVYGGID
jgi:drug/metabolite transporter (DMT)-like permease